MSCAEDQSQPLWIQGPAEVRPAWVWLVGMWMCRTRWTALWTFPRTCPMVCLSVILLCHRITCLWFCNESICNKKQGGVLSVQDPGNCFHQKPFAGALHTAHCLREDVWNIIAISFLMTQGHCHCEQSLMCATVIKFFICFLSFPFLPLTLTCHFCCHWACF